MITEATQVSLLGGVNKLPFGQRHEVKMLDALLIVLHHTAAESAFIDYFANILEDEFAGHQVLVRTEAESFLVGLDDCDVGILLSQETLVLTFSAATAIPHTFHFGCAIDAVRILTARIVDFGDGICDLGQPHREHATVMRLCV